MERVLRGHWLCEFPASGVMSRADYSRGLVLNTLAELTLHGRDAFERYVEALWPALPLTCGDGSVLTMERPEWAQFFTRFSEGRLATWESGAWVEWGAGCEQETQSVQWTSGQEGTMQLDVPVKHETLNQEAEEA